MQDQDIEGLIDGCFDGAISDCDQQRIDAVRDMLRHKKLADAVAILPSIADNYRRKYCADDVMTVAVSMASESTIKALLKLSFDQAYYREELFNAGIKALLEMGCDDIALSAIFYSSVSQQVRDDNWFVLAQHHIATKEYDKLERVYPQLTQSYHKQKLTEQCLCLPDISASWQRYLCWLQRYFGLEKGLSDRTIQQIVDLISHSKQLESRLATLRECIPAHYYDRLAVCLSIQWLSQQQFQRCEMLEPYLSEETAWLVQLRLQFERVTDLSVLDKLKYQSKLEAMFDVLIDRWMRCEDERGGDLFAENLIMQAKKSLVFSSNILVAACHRAIQLQKINLAVCLIETLDNYQIYGVLKSLADCQLTETQQTRILRVIDLDTCYRRDYLELFPQAFVEIEQKRRADEKKQQLTRKFTELGKLKNVSRNHAMQTEVNATIEAFLELGQVLEALVLCRVLVPSNLRDQHVQSTLSMVFKADSIDYEIAQSAAELFNRKEERAAAVRVIRAFKATKHVAVVKHCMSMQGAFANAMLQRSVAAILMNPNSHQALESLRSCGFLSHWQCGQLEKAKIAGLLITAYGSKYTKLVKRLKAWRAEGITGFGGPVIEHLLRDDALDHAIQLCNGFVAEKWAGYHELPDEFSTPLRNYLRTIEGSKEVFSRLSKLDIDSERRFMMRIVCEQARATVSDNAVTVLGCCPDEGLRANEAEHLVADAVISGDFMVARLGVELVDATKKRYWNAIIIAIERGNYVDVINTFLREARFIPSIVNWLLPKWLDGKSAPYCMQTALTLSKYLRKCDTTADGVENFDGRQRQLQSKLQCTAMIVTVWQRWWGAVQPDQVDIHSLCTDISRIYSEVGEGRVRDEIERTVKCYVVQLMSEKKIKRVFDCLQMPFLLAALSSHERDVYFSAILEAGDWLLAEQYIPYLRGQSGHCWASIADRMVCKLLEKYLEKRAYQRILAIPEKHLNYEARRLLVDHVKALILARNINIAKPLIHHIWQANNEREVLPIVDALIQRGYVILAKAGLTKHIKTPNEFLRLQKQSESAYWQKLGGLIGDDVIPYVRGCCIKLIQLRQIELPDVTGRAAHLQNDIITEMRSQLDKAMMAFCRTHIEDFEGRNVYFPMIRRDTGEQIHESLNGRFSTMRLRYFAHDFPRIFAFIESVQPGNNPNMACLETLYPIANVHKHDHNVPLLDHPDQFLAQVIDAVTLIVLKLKNPRLEVVDLQAFLPSAFSEHLNSPDQRIQASRNQF